MLSSGNKLFFHTFPDDNKHICEKYSDRIRERYLLYTKDLRKEQQIIMLPVYMTPMM